MRTILEKILIAAGFLIIAAAVFMGYREFYFITDDAYITFRYISNSMLGYGWVWNPPPFAPVEGYSNFLWMVILEGIWRIAGVAPPQSVGWVTLLCGYATLFFSYLLLKEIRIPDSWRPYRPFLIFISFVGIVTNRTFLAWLSSGLETGLLTFLIVGWIYWLTQYEKTKNIKFLWFIATFAALATLTRPDGLLMVAGSMALIIFESVFRKQKCREFILFSSFPLTAVAIHMAWRHHFYGFWFPNTYYAKHLAAWPESGLRYFGSFFIEYGLVVWLIIFILLTAKSIAAIKTLGWHKLFEKAPLFVAAGVIVGHFFYYTLIIGGDHFEYRVYAHLIPLLFIAFYWMIARLFHSCKAAMAAIVIFIFFSWPIPWVHYARTRNLLSRAETFMLRMPVAPSFPSAFRWYVAPFDKWQWWLVTHAVCMRHQEHKLFTYTQSMRCPKREEGEKISGLGTPVAILPYVGMPGWTMPRVAIIDMKGLNDKIIARNNNPNLPSGDRKMAHDRIPPPGYLECFSPNVTMMNGKVTVTPREVDLTDQKIEECEKTYWEKVCPGTKYQ